MPIHAKTMHNSISATPQAKSKKDKWPESNHRKIATRP